MNDLQRETERQNRIYQDAIARKKKQIDADEPRTEPQFAGAAGGNGVGMGFRQDGGRQAVAGGAQHDPAQDDGARDGPAQQWADRISDIPEIRSALVPLDAPEGTGWSKPFSLVKADMEPWLSFYRGYMQSRLFLDMPSAPDAGGKEGLSVDFAVRALLDLKQVNPKVILEPPVQINGQVAYAELEEGLRACRNEAEAKWLMKSANDVHEAQLRKAVDKGREMGQLLYDALMGEGHVHLIAAWGDVYKRKPTVEELHLMLTTGRTKMPAPRRMEASAAEEGVPDRKAVAAAAAENRPQKQSAPLASKEIPSPAITSSAGARRAGIPAKAERTGWLENKLEALSPGYRLLLPIFLAAAGCAALVALGLAGLI